VFDNLMIDVGVQSCKESYISLISPLLVFGNLLNRPPRILLLTSFLLVA